MRTCENCHYGHEVTAEYKPCAVPGGCYFQHGLPAWEPLTNGDMVRRKSNRELAIMLINYRNLGKHVTLQDIEQWLESEAKE